MSRHLGDGLYSRTQLQEFLSQLRQEYRVIPPELKQKGELELLEVFYRNTIDKLFGFGEANLEQIRARIEESVRAQLDNERREVELAHIAVCEEVRKLQQQREHQQQELEQERAELAAKSRSIEDHQRRIRGEYLSIQRQRQQALQDCEEIIAEGKRKAERQIEPLQQELEQGWADLREKVKRVELYYSQKLTELGG